MTLATAPAAVVLNVQLESRFNELCQRLVSRPPGTWREQPLAYWVMGGDRRLPRAFLGYPVGQILATPYAELAATAGVGPKKMAALLVLLQRVAADGNQPASTLAGETPAAPEKHLRAAGVSESVWAQWRETVRQSGWKEEPLGRFAESLRELPRVIWHVPLASYLPLSLADVRALKTHGQKRVQAVLDVFATVARAAPHGAACFGSRPSIRSIADVERWMRSAAFRNEPISADEIRMRLWLPLYRQLQVDVGEQVAGLVAGRLGLFGPETPVAQAARQFGVTRARVYQLLGEAAAALAVRWPDGPGFVRMVSSKLAQEPDSQERVAAFDACARLLFPSSADQPTAALPPTMARHSSDERRPAEVAPGRANPAVRSSGPRMPQTPERGPATASAAARRSLACT